MLDRKAREFVDNKKMWAKQHQNKQANKYSSPCRAPENPGIRKKYSQRKTGVSFEFVGRSTSKPPLNINSTPFPFFSSVSPLLLEVFVLLIAIPLCPADAASQDGLGTKLFRNRNRNRAPLFNSV